MNRKRVWKNEAMEPRSGGRKEGSVRGGEGGREGREGGREAVKGGWRRISEEKEKRRKRRSRSGLRRRRYGREERSWREGGETCNACMHAWDRQADKQARHTGRYRGGRRRQGKARQGIEAYRQIGEPVPPPPPQPQPRSRASRREVGTQHNTARPRVQTAFAELRSAHGETFRLVYCCCWLLAAATSCCCCCCCCCRCCLPTVDCRLLLSVCRAASCALGFHLTNLRATKLPALVLETRNGRADPRLPAWI